MRSPTPRQVEILGLFAEGHGRYEDVAKTLGISTDTVRTHLEHAYLILGEKSKQHAVALAIRKGLL